MAALVLFVVLILEIVHAGKSIAISLEEEQEAAILLRFKQSLLAANPSALPGWRSTATSPCDWPGIICRSKRVVSIDLSHHKLSGSIPDAIAELLALETLTLASNSLNGTIPSLAPTLRTLDLSNNAISGGLPRLLLSPRIQSLNLSKNNLTGSIHPDLFLSCPALQRLDLSSNQLRGSIPGSIARCRALEFLSLQNNSLAGEIPSEIGNLDSLGELSLANNHLVGSIPESIFLPSLRSLDLSVNNISGSVPASIGRSANLSSLVLSQNQLTSVPNDLGLLTSLRILVLGRNNLTTLPDSIASCRELRVLLLSANLLEGEIPAAIAELSKLQFLVVHTNQLTGPIPDWIATRHPDLLHLDLSDNQLSGAIPAAIGALSELKFLLLAGNHLTGSIPAALGDASQLQFLDLSSNRLTGPIPPSIGRLSKLLWLMLAKNGLSGSIPASLGNCSSLLWLNAAKNSLRGSLPPELEWMGREVHATFEENIGNLPEVPKEIGECAVLRRWLPSDYPPFSLVDKVLDRDRCQRFWNLLLRGRFIYSVCSSIPTERSMGYIQLSENALSGAIPESFGGIDRLSLLFLYQNRLSGPIPGSLSKLMLTGLNLSHNSLSGSIPDSFGDFQCMQSLDLSTNLLSGRIPAAITRLTSLTKFNVSYNPMLSGPIPFAQQLATFDQASYIGDYRLCYVPTATGTINPASSAIPFCGDDPGSTPGGSRARSSQPMHASTILGISLACALGVVVVGLAAICYMTRSSRGAPARGASGAAAAALRCDLGIATDSYGFKVMKSSSARFDHSILDASVSVFTMDLPKQLTYNDLVAATGSFHDSNIIGCGGFGIVYKARLLDGSTVAVKKLIREGPAAEREFQAEMHTLGHVVHENLVPLMGYSSFGAQKLLVYELMDNGSLEDWLYGGGGAAGKVGLGGGGLDWPRRLDVAIGTARGLKFLHHGSSPPIIHRDMKASNILLDANFRARLTDFGLARALAGQEETHVSTIVAGTLGYVPPEYCQTWRATVKGDVYSFGVVLLELLSGQRPMLDAAGNYGVGRCNDDYLEEFDQCSNLVEWAVECSRTNRLAKLFDPYVLQTAPGSHDELVKFLRLALDCTQDIPVRRPCMRDVLRRLEDIRDGCV